MSITAIFHININCTDLDRSIAFYQDLGFKVAADLGEIDGGDVMRGLGLSTDSKARAAILSLDPSQARLARIDLIQWLRPQTHGEPTHSPPHSDLAGIGLARLTLWTRNIAEEVDRLQGLGIEFIAEPLSIPGGDGIFACFRDPDGTVIELIETHVPSA
jgi:catechol 2,3-dioxygenase-like lactoylglutathione lyase family enzyme